MATTADPAAVVVDQENLIPGWGRSTGASPNATAPHVGPLFFPQSQSLGIDRGSYHPHLLRQVVSAGFQNTSFATGRDELLNLARLKISEQPVERVTERIGQERVEQRDSQVQAFVGLPVMEKFAAAVAHPRTGRWCRGMGDGFRSGIGRRAMPRTAARPALSRPRSLRAPQVWPAESRRLNRLGRPGPPGRHRSRSLWWRPGPPGRHRSRSRPRPWLEVVTGGKTRSVC
jgi:hypothetical protein